MAGKITKFVSCFFFSKAESLQKLCCHLGQDESQKRFEFLEVVGNFKIDILCEICNTFVLSSLFFVIFEILDLNNASIIC